MSGRLWVVLLFCVGLSLAWVAPGHAVPLDRGFAKRGALGLRAESKGGIAYANRFATSPRGDIYVLMNSYACNGPKCGQPAYLTRFRSNGRLDPTFGRDGKLLLAPGRGEAAELAVDRRGRALVGFSEPKRIVILRLAPGGAIDRSFGSAGSVRLPCDCGRYAEPRILPLPSGGILVASLRDREADRGRTLFVTVAVRRLDPEGRTDWGYGTHGTALARIDNATHVGTATLLSDGSLAFAGDGGYHGGGPWVARIGPRGRLDRDYFRRVRRLMRARLGGEGHDSAVGGIVPRRGAAADVFGQDRAHGYMLRLRPDGHPASGFGRRGVKRLPRPVVNVVPVPSGRNFLVAPRLERGGWVSEYGLFSAWANRDGELLRGFGAGGRGLRWANPYGQVALLHERWPLLLDPGYPDIGCRSYCPPSPVLYRFRAR